MGFSKPDSYLAAGELLPRLSTLTTRNPNGGNFLCTFLKVTFTGSYPAPCPVEPGLSSRSLRTERSPEPPWRPYSSRDSPRDHAARASSQSPPNASYISAMRERSLRLARASIWRARSRETPSRRPISANDNSSSPSAIKRFSTM
jgi:hypothetical protein